MAVLNVDQLWLAYSDGVAQRTCLFTIKNADAADTVDVAAYFKVVKRAGIVSATGTTIASITGIAGTNLTVPAGPIDDALWLIVVGVSA